MVSCSRETIQGLARRLAEKSATRENQLARQQWTDHNSLHKTRPPVLCRVWEVVFSLLGRSTAENELERQIEDMLKVLNFKIDLADDQVFEPCLWLPAVFKEKSLFGLLWEPESSPSGGAYRYKRVLKTLEDVKRIQTPDNQIDERATKEMKERAEDLLDGILTIKIDRMRRFRILNYAYFAANYLGMDGLLTALAEEPELMHALMRRFQDIHHDYLLTAEREGMLHLNCRGDGGIFNGNPLCTENLPQPDFDGGKVRLRDLWVYSDTQELGLVSPAMCEEFFFRYHLPLMKWFGLVNFGCCESHHNKWHLIRQIPNLRRVSVSPWTDLGEAVREMGGRVILNWRVNVSNVVTQASPQNIRKEIRQGLKVAQGCPIEVFLQDAETVLGHDDILHTWVRIAREETERYMV